VAASARVLRSPRELRRWAIGVLRLDGARWACPLRPPCDRVSAAACRSVRADFDSLGGAGGVCGELFVRAGEAIREAFSEETNVPAAHRIAAGTTIAPLVLTAMSGSRASARRPLPDASPVPALRRPSCLQSAPTVIPPPSHRPRNSEHPGGCSVPMRRRDTGKMLNDSEVPAFPTLGCRSYQCLNLASGEISEVDGITNM
jgi:hypothetical protein